MQPFPVLYAIVDVDVCARTGWMPADLARAYLAGGARLLQLRAKQLASGAMLDLAAEIARDAQTAGGELIVNDRADVAVLAGAAGVHVGQEDLSPADVRRVSGEHLVVGLSTHSTAQIEAALQQPISYLAIGPVFMTATKATGYSERGLEAVSSAVRLASPS